MSKGGGERRQLAKTCEIRQMTPLSTTQEWRNKSQGVTERKEESSDNLTAEYSQLVEVDISWRLSVLYILQHDKQKYDGTMSLISLTMGV